MAAGDILLDASGNVILDASGNVQLSDGAGDGCCCGGGEGCTTCISPSPCLYCDPDTPTDFTVSFTGVNVQTLCLTCDTDGSIKITGGTAVAAGVFSGTFTLTQGPDGACYWEWSEPSPSSVTVGFFSDVDCETPYVLSPPLIIRLTKIDGTTFRLSVYFEADVTYYLFDQTYTVSDGDCCTVQAPSNAITDYSCDSVFGLGGAGYLGKDGSATVTPC